MQPTTCLFFSLLRSDSGASGNHCKSLGIPASAMLGDRNYKSTCLASPLLGREGVYLRIGSTECPEARERSLLKGTFVERTGFDVMGIPLALFGPSSRDQIPSMFSCPISTFCKSVRIISRLRCQLASARGVNASEKPRLPTVPFCHSPA
jgi:hypothetical protein